MAEEISQDPETVPIEQFKGLQAEYNRLKKSKQKEFRSGFLTGSNVVGVIAVFYSSCNSCQGDIQPTPKNNYNNYADAADVLYNHGDAGIIDASTATITPNCPDGQSCYSDHQICRERQDCYDVALVDYLEEKLEACLAENEKLSKPKSCPTYTPKGCPPVRECPKVEECLPSPYFRRGD